VEFKLLTAESMNLTNNRANFASQYQQHDGS